MYELLTDSWRSGPIVVASGARARFTGIRRRDVLGVLLRTCSVHTFGMWERIVVVALEGRGMVLEARVLDPRRVYVRRDATWILETRAASLPAAGDGTRLVRRSDDRGDQLPRPALGRRP